MYKSVHFCVKGNILKENNFKRNIYSKRLASKLPYLIFTGGVCQAGGGEKKTGEGGKKKTEGGGEKKTGGGGGERGEKKTEGGGEKKKTGSRKRSRVLLEVPSDLVIH